MQNTQAGGPSSSQSYGLLGFHIGVQAVKFLKEASGFTLVVLGHLSLSPISWCIEAYWAFRNEELSSSENPWRRAFSTIKRKKKKKEEIRQIIEDRRIEKEGEKAGEEACWQ